MRWGWGIWKGFRGNYWCDEGGGDEDDGGSGGDDADDVDSLHAPALLVPSQLSFSGSRVQRTCSHSENLTSAFRVCCCLSGEHSNGVEAG